MQPPNDAELKTVPLGAEHLRSEFSSGSEPFDRYLRQQASQDAKRYVAAPFVLAEGDGTIVGYYTLSSLSVGAAELSPALIKRLPRYPHFPATLLGRLAVDGRFRGRGFGRFLLADALYRALRSDVASFAVVVDPKDEAAVAFYGREGFLPFLDQGSRLYIPMRSVAELFPDR